MGVENHGSYVEQAFRDNTVESSPLGKKFNNLSKHFGEVKAFGSVTNANRAEVGESVGNLLEAFSRGYKSVEQMENVATDPNKTERQKQFAMDDLDLLGKVIYDGIREDEKFVELIRKGSASEIDENLPEELKGIGKLVLTNVFEEGPVLDCLEELDEVRTSMRRMPEKVRDENLGEAVGEAIKTLRKLKGLTPGQNYDKEMAMTYLGMEAEELKRNGEAKESRNDEDNNKKADNSSEMLKYLKQNAEYSKASAEYAKRKGILEGEIEEVSLGELLDSYLKIKAPRERAPQMWEYEVPEFMGNMSLEKWRKLLSFEDALVGAIYDKRNDVAYNNMIDKMVQGILSKKSLEEGDLKEWYEDETINLRGVMHQISRELLVEKQIEAVVPRKDEKSEGTSFEKVVRTIYVFDTGKDGKGNDIYVEGSRVEEFVNNEVNYKQALAGRLVENGVVDNIDAAKLSVALAMDIMELGGVFSGADVLRKLTWESDVVRLSQKPERKYSSKVSSGELFAGPWTELANTLSQGDPKKAIELVKSWGVVPELLAGSFLDQKLRKTDDNTMMYMIYNDEKISFKDLGNDLFFGWRKDHIQPAARTWMYIANKTPLEFSKQREFDNVISAWRTDFYNDFAQLKKNEDSLMPISVVAGVLGGSIGLWPFAGPYLRIGGMRDPDRNRNYVTYSEEIFRAMGLSDSEKDELRSFFGVDRRSMGDFNNKIIDLRVAQNMYSNEKLKRSMWTDKHLLKPRK